MFGPKREKLNDELVNEAAFTMTECHTEDYRQQVAAAKAQAIFEYHEALIPLGRIIGTIMARYQRMQGASAEESA